MNYFEMLGVTEDCTDEEVKSKYKEKLRKFHPDSNVGADKGDQIFYGMMTRHLREAYEHLKTREKRIAYISELNIGIKQKESMAYANQGVGLINEVYLYISERADSNSLIQGISGIAGFPWNLVADAGTIFTHYVPMVNRIREYFGYKRFEGDVIEVLIKSIAEDLMLDVIGDKLLGSIPILGMYFNYKCAKIMTWRIGILFAIVNSQGEIYNERVLKESAKLVRQAFSSEMLSSDSENKVQRFMELLLEIYTADNGYEKIKELNKIY